MGLRISLYCARRDFARAERSFAQFLLEPADDGGKGPRRLSHVASGKDPGGLGAAVFQQEVEVVDGGLQVVVSGPARTLPGLRRCCASQHVFISAPSVHDSVHARLRSKNLVEHKIFAMPQIAVAGGLENRIPWNSSTLRELSETGDQSEESVDHGLGRRGIVPRNVLLNFEEIQLGATKNADLSRHPRASRRRAANAFTPIPRSP